MADIHIRTTPSMRPVRSNEPAWIIPRMTPPPRNSSKHPAYHPTRITLLRPNPVLTALSPRSKNGVT